MCAALLETRPLPLSHHQVLLKLLIEQSTLNLTENIVEQHKGSYITAYTLNYLIVAYNWLIIIAVPLGMVLNSLVSLLFGFFEVLNAFKDRTNVELSFPSKTNYLHIFECS